MNKWISVKERLPKNMEEVLVTDGSEAGVASAFYSPNLKTWHANDYLLSIKSETGGIIIIDSLITHWMPLPKPPT